MWASLGANGSRGFYDLDLARIERLDNPSEVSRRARRPRDRNFVTFLDSEDNEEIAPCSQVIIIIIITLFERDTYVVVPFFFFFGIIFRLVFVTIATGTTIATGAPSYVNS